MIGSWIAGALSGIVFLLFQAKGIYTGDSGDLVTAAVVGGIPHPPGYPLYTWLGWLASYVPLFTPSWRVTLLSSLSHAATVGLVYALIYRVTRKNVWASIFGAATLVANYLFFSIALRRRFLPCLICLLCCFGMCCLSGRNDRTYAICILQALCLVCRFPTTM